LETARIAVNSLPRGATGSYRGRLIEIRPARALGGAPGRWVCRVRWPGHAAGMRVGLVLGAGGVVGAAWLIGALDALHEETGWSPAEADHIVGTSGGAVVGALLADGLEPSSLSAYATGHVLDEGWDADVRLEALAARLGGRQRMDAIASRLTGTQMRPEFALPPLGPGSWPLALTTLRAPWRYTPSAVVAGWLPRGWVSTRPIIELVDAFVERDGPRHPAFWSVATDYATGRRVPFGREDAPVVRVGYAVAASCAIPGLYQPVRLAGRRYVDGGVSSPSNLDLLAGRELDVVIALNPSSSLAELIGGSPAERAAAAMRAMAGRRLGYEARKLRASGTEVVLLQPSREDLTHMGLNLMAHRRRRRIRVVDVARASTTEALRELRAAGVTLPGRPGRRHRARRRTADGDATPPTAA
jgi:NTE family protein